MQGTIKESVQTVRNESQFFDADRKIFRKTDCLSEKFNVLFELKQKYPR